MLEDKSPNSARESGILLRKVTPDGTLSTILDDHFDSMRPGRAFADRAGNIYITAYPSYPALYGSFIYLLAPDGTLKRFAGSNAGYSEAMLDGVGLQVGFSGVGAFGIDSRGTLWLSDSAPMSSLPGILRTLAPDGTVRSPEPGSVTTPDWSADMNGNTYAMLGNAVVGNTIVRTAPDGSTTVLAGGDTAEFYTGPLPGKLKWAGQLTRTGPATYVFSSGAALIKLVVPH